MDRVVTRGNLFRELPSGSVEEELRTLATGSGARVERIVSTGQASPRGFWYDQAQDEWVVVLRGRAGLELEGREPVELESGDWVLIRAHQRHRVAWTSTDEPTVWLAVHFAG